MLKYLALDRFSLLLLLMIALAVIAPISGQAATQFSSITNLAIAILFLLHGAKLSPQAVWQGIRHWKLHLLVLGITFVLFPLFGLALRPMFEPLLGQQLYYGVLFLCVLPSTVQSSIAFTSLARGNVAAAVCSASFSNVLGMLLTPILVALLILGQQQHQFDASYAIAQIAFMLLLPFVLGQLLRPWLYPQIHRHPKIVKVFDQGSILLVVYGAFSASVVAGLWQQLSMQTLGILLVLCLLLLFLVMMAAWHLPKRLGFNRADQITIFFCGSKKTLASGIPMAQILFLGQPLGLLVLPIMLFHQLQLMLCAVLAAKWSQSAE